MKTLVILSMAVALLASPSWGYKQEDLDKLAATNACEECDLHGAYLERAVLGVAFLPLADLREANLGVPDLINAVLRDAKIDFADFTKAKFCNTVMPDRQRIFKDC